MIYVACTLGGLAVGIGATSFVYKILLRRLWIVAFKKDFQK